MQGSWAWTLYHALGTTIRLCLVTFAASLVLSALLATASSSPWRPLRIVTRVVVDLLRSIPILALLIFVYYGLGKYTASWQISPFWMAAIALTLGESAFLSEIFRAGIEAIPRSQWEAAKSLGFSWLATLRLVIAPQTLLPSMPAIVNMGIFTLKDSSLASIIAVPEITQAANDLVSNTFMPFQVFSLLALFYLGVILPFTLFAGLAERLIARHYGLQSDRAKAARA
jgi:His/Glu/Gln/Arg/opine family amino acid ABC transporter permease subunit